jgi:hypothetical protein
MTRRTSISCSPSISLIIIPFLVNHPTELASKKEAVALLEGAFELNSRAWQHFLAASAP